MTDAEKILEGALKQAQDALYYRMDQVLTIDLLSARVDKLANALACTIEVIKHIHATPIQD